MKLLKTPRTRLAQLQTLAETTINICKNIPSLSLTTEKLTIVYKAFKEAMVKEQASAEKKQELDRLRDKINSGFFAAVDSENLFPHEEDTVKATLADLTGIIEKYGFQINRLAYDEETAQIDNMLADIEKLDLSPLDNTGLTRWMPLIEQANSNFKQSAGQYISESAEASTIDAAGKYVTELKSTLDGLYSILYAQLLLEPADDLQKAYNELEILLKSMN